MPSRTRFVVSKSFSFEAAHYFRHMSADHPFSQMHGHSFAGRVWVEGAPDPQSGFIESLWDLDQRIKAVVANLDHRLLNEVEGLAHASLELLAAYVFERLEPSTPGLLRVEVSRPSCGEAACIERVDS